MSHIELVIMNEYLLKKVWELGFTQELPEWKKWDAPYFEGDYRAYNSFESFYEDYSKFFLSDHVRGILCNNELVGVVTKYWENEATRWLNVGITIYTNTQWGLGIGTTSLRLWIDDIFNTTKNLEHIGLVTWSGNARMIKVAEKLGMKKEATIRKVRYYKEVYYDSVSYGILREEWKNNGV